MSKEDRVSKSYKVYRYTFPNGKIYIGVTSLSLAERRDNGYNHNKALKAAIKEYGWRGFSKEIIYDNLTEEDAFRKEVETIAKFNATNPLVGYNISHGGNATFSGLKHTNESKEKISKINTGRKFSDESLERMRESHAKERKPVICLDKNRLVVSKYGSLFEAATAISGHKSNISRACATGRSYKGYFWQFMNDYGR